MKSKFRIPALGFTSVALLLLSLTGCATRQMEARLPGVGERLALKYTCRLADNTVAATNRREIGEDETIAKAEIFSPPRRYRPAVVTVPENPAQVTVDYFGSFEEKIVQTLAQQAAALPLNQSASRKLTGVVPADIPQHERFLQMGRQVKLQRRMVVSMDQYREQYEEPPVAGQMLGANEKFSTMIEKVEDEQVHLLFSAAPGATRRTIYGVEHYIQEENEFLVRLEVTPGAVIRTGPLVGRISKVEEETFTIDYGHPFGGEALSCLVEARPLAEISESGSLGWLNNYEQGLAQARREDKPVFLMLYADWCKWCHKMFDEVLQDKQLIALQNRFVWLRINSDIQEQFMEQFGQEKFPTLVVLDPEGRELKKMVGFKDAPALRHELESILKSRTKS